MLIIKRIVSAALAALLTLSFCPGAGAEAAPSVSARSAVVLHSGGEVVFEKNADEPMLIASTTKLMTAIVTIENADVEEEVEIQPEWCGIEGSSMYLKPGETYTVRELLAGLLLASGNDAAAALAGHVAGGEDAFAELMNQTAKRLRMNASHFVNPHGLNAEGHRSSAGDLARLMDYCMLNPVFAQIIAMKKCTVGGQTFYNHNKLLDTCPGCLGGKTGYTELAGRCLVSCVEREGTRFICVTLSDPDDWNDHKKLYDWAFSLYSDREVTAGQSFQIPLVSGTRETVTAVPEPIRLFLPKEARLTLTYEMPRFVFAPVRAGDQTGTVSVYYAGAKIAEGRLLYRESAEPASPVERIKGNEITL